MGDAIVTSNISDKYLPGILIGYITTMTTDSNDLTKSGTLTPVVDFKHLQDVLIITQVKDVGTMEIKTVIKRYRNDRPFDGSVLYSPDRSFLPPAAGGVTPNLMLILTASFGFMRGRK